MWLAIQKFQRDQVIPTIKTVQKGNQIKYRKPKEVSYIRKKHQLEKIEAIVEIGSGRDNKYKTMEYPEINVRIYYMREMVNVEKINFSINAIGIIH